MNIIPYFDYLGPLCYGCDDDFFDAIGSQTGYRNASYYISNERSWRVLMLVSLNVFRFLT